MNNNELQKIIKRGNISNELKRIADIYEENDRCNKKNKKIASILSVIYMVVAFGGLIALILINVL